jgi:diguanylate cyclase (GGDEF)-like protein
MKSSRFLRNDLPRQDVLAGATEAVEAERVALLGCCAFDAAAAAGRFEEAGFRVEVASTAGSLLRRLDDQAVSIVVVDADLPTIGRQRIDQTVLRTLANREIPVLVVCFDESQIRDTLDAGAADVIRKPVSWALAARRAAAAADAVQMTDKFGRMERTLDEVIYRSQFDRKRAERMDRVDQVTGLPNSKAFEKLVEDALAVRRRSGAHVAVLHLDLGRFTDVNETFGRRGGDEVLRQVASRLEQLLQGNDGVRCHGSGLVTAAVARSNGTRFHAVLGNIRKPGDATTIAREMLDSLAEPCTVETSHVYVRGRVGIALAPSDGEDVEALLRFSDMAMCAAARCVPGTVRFFNPSLNSVVERRLTIDRLLRGAIERNELFVHYQPLVQAASGDVVGAEALLRWHNPELGAVQPVEFIPVAEESGQMVQIGTWVLREALRQQRAWLDEGMSPIEMSINVSRCQLLSGSFTETVQAELDRVGVPPELVVLELSERGVLNHDPEILRQIQDLKGLGVRLAVDDFGIGESGIAYLRVLDFDVLKIDQSYINRLADSPDDATITSSMIAMARQLRLEVVAEGVEDTQQLEWLRSWGCNTIQGFVYSRPLAPDVFSDSVMEKIRVS